jgi:hypothetical protein
MVDAGEIFHPLRWSPQEAFRFLGDVPELERAGVVVRMPATWKVGRPPRPQVTATVGGRAPSRLGKDALLDFRMEVTLDGERSTPAEVKEILASASGLALIRGRWVEVTGPAGGDGSVPGRAPQPRAPHSRGDAMLAGPASRRGGLRPILIVPRVAASGCRDPEAAAHA